LPFSTSGHDFADSANGSMFSVSDEKRYKRKLLQKVICNQDFDQTQSINKDIVKFHTVKDALYMLSDAWYEGSPESIFKPYDKLGFEQQ